MSNSNTIYDAHRQAFRDVSAYVVLYDGKLVARVTLKRAASGTRTTAFVHWIGQPMVRGIANGGGYDKASASVSSAASRMAKDLDAETGTFDPDRKYLDFRRAALEDNGRDWSDALRREGFTVLQAV